MSVTYKLPYDTPLRYLPLVYILPYDLLMRCPTLRKLPRRMGAFNARNGRKFWGAGSSETKSWTLWRCWCSPLRLRRLEGALQWVFPGVVLVLRPVPMGQGDRAGAGLGAVAGRGAGNSLRRGLRAVGHQRAEGLSPQMVSHPLQKGQDRFAGGMYGGRGQRHTRHRRPGGGGLHRAGVLVDTV